MASKTGIDRLSGLLLLLILVTIVVSGVLAAAVPLNYEEAAETLRNVAEQSGRHTADIVFDLLSYIAMVLLAGALYLAFSPHHRTLALLGTLGLAAAGTILAVHDMVNFALTSIAKKFVAVSGAEAVALQAVGGSMIITAKWGVTVGFTFFALGILAYSALMVASNAVPRVLGWEGVVAGVLTFSTWLPHIDSDLDPVAMIAFFPMMLWELGLGLWLIFRGTREAAEPAPASR